LSVRRRIPPAEQLAVIRSYLESGRPLVGLRTASHAFSLRDKPDGWPNFDKEVLGGDYQMHYDNAPGTGPATVYRLVGGAETDSILAGVNGEFASNAHLYRNKTLAASAKPLLRGQIGPNGSEKEFVAWTNSYKGGRIFYTSLGYIDDFKDESFRR